MALSDRQKVLAHLVRMDAKFENPKDLFTYLAIQFGDNRSEIRDQREFIMNLLDSGYESTTAKKFYDDYKEPGKMVKDAAKEPVERETEVEPDPPQDLMEQPATITDPDETV